MESIFVKIEFYSPVVFQPHTTVDWKIPSDMIFRALTYAISRLYGGKEVEKLCNLIERKSLTISSLSIIKNDSIYIPHSGYLGYITLDESDVIDISDIKDLMHYVTVPRDQKEEPVPFTYPILHTEKYKWGLIVNGPKELIIRRILPALRLLGEFGIGARKSKGTGKFKVIDVYDLQRLNVKISEKGILCSRYLPKNSDIWKQKEIITERFMLTYGSKKYSFEVISEGSRLKEKDEGTVKFVKNDLGHKVPVLLRPLLLKKI